MMSFQWPFISFPNFWSLFFHIFFRFGQRFATKNSQMDVLPAIQRGGAMQGAGATGVAAAGACRQPRAEGVPILGRLRERNQQV